MERESKFAEIAVGASGMSVVDGPTAPEGKLYFAEGVSGERPGELSRQNGKLAADNLGRGITGFGQMWSPLGYLVNLQQQGWGYFEGSGSDGSRAGGPTGLNGIGPIAEGTPGLPLSPYVSATGEVVATKALPYQTATDYGDMGSGVPPRPSPDPGAPTWYADYVATGANELCNPVPLTGSLQMVGAPPWTYEYNTCVAVEACGLHGRGVKFLSSDGVQKCFLTGAGFYSFSASYRLEN